METTKIELFDKAGKMYLKFIFNGQFEPVDADYAIKKWKDYFSTYPSMKFVIIWDCMSMSGYNNESRIKWQNTLKEMKNQIEFIWIITKSPLFKIGASVMTLLTGIELKVVNSEKGIVY